MQSDTVISHSPSFNTYSSSDTLAQIAARVVQEFQLHSHDDFDHDYLFHLQTEEEQQQQQLNNYNHESDQNDDEEEEEEEEFEFAIPCREPDLSPIPADQIFYNGQIRPVYPLFNTDLLFADDVQVDNSVSSATPKTSIPARLPLGKLFIEERERDSASCSSSEADELDGVPVGTYCVWRPKAEEESAGRCKKSNSTGSSKRWKFRDLLYRSNSEGKDTLVFLAPSNRKRETKVKKGMNEAAKIIGNEHPNGVIGEGVSDQRRSYLPHKKDMVGVFANVSGVSRNLHPF